jgi:hypothetical protein
MCAAHPKGAELRSSSGCSRDANACACMLEAE